MSSRSPMETAADMGTTGKKNFTISSDQGPTRGACPDTARDAGAFYENSVPYLRTSRFRDTNCLQRKIILPGFPRRRLRVRLRFTATWSAKGPVSFVCPGWWNINPIPSFGRRARQTRACVCVFGRRSRLFRKNQPLWGLWVCRTP
ncbi:hypothetical protein JTE90_025228 [Oedothorax gibbosus]|uniref:Uncharacterized protein n=1 Tax=Oedothorax gibbosus TaxID=931172 RepID=A0AAV6TJL2_9ARAC|nr:hypothetical protein JTE90_025228 [Oedothorax gibbosus]